MTDGVGFVLGVGVAVGGGVEVGVGVIGVGVTEGVGVIGVGVTDGVGVTEGVTGASLTARRYFITGPPASSDEQSLKSTVQ